MVKSPVGSLHSGQDEMGVDLADGRSQAHAHAAGNGLRELPGASGASRPGNVEKKSDLCDSLQIML